MRIGAWQHVFAAAAIVFLTVGLATIVYFVLPGHGKGGGDRESRRALRKLRRCCISAGCAGG